MVNLFYRLALHPDHTAKIRDELSRADWTNDSKALKELDHMNGAINEVLRLHPSVPTGGYRETPPEGLDIAGTWIPGGVTIVAPRYTMGRRKFLSLKLMSTSKKTFRLNTSVEKSYQRPEEFIPERWYSRPEMVADKRIFTPFSIGRYSCVGKNLALAEIRFATALLVSKYDIAFAPGEDGTRVLKEMKDQFTAVPGKLELVFTPIKA